MKKMIIIAMCLFLSACTLKTKVLAFPQNIKLVEEVFYWDASEQADYYVVCLNNHLITVIEPMFSIVGLDDGVHRFKVKAVGEGYQDSIYSNVYIFTIDHSLPVPTDLSVEEGVLRWSYPISDVIFSVYINGVSVETLTNSYDLSQLNLNTIYEIYVVAQHDMNQSLPSSIFDYYTYNNIYRQLYASFDKASENPLLFDLEEELLLAGLEDNTLHENDIELLDGIVSIANEYFQQQNYGNHVIRIPTSKGLIFMKVKINDSRPPEVEHGPNIKFKVGECVRISFVEHNKNLIEITGNGIQVSDYDIQGRYVTIDNGFIQKFFDGDPTRQTIILAAHFAYEEGEMVVYFYINRR
ncbi:MAG: hypothetical protein WCQ80_03275 [Bacilli bacterium]